MPSEVPGMSILTVTRRPSNAALRAGSVCASAGTGADIDHTTAPAVATKAVRTDVNITAPSEGSLRDVSAAQLEGFSRAYSCRAAATIGNDASACAKP